MREIWRDGRDMIRIMTGGSMAARRRDGEIPRVGDTGAGRREAETDTIHGAERPETVKRRGAAGERLHMEDVRAGEWPGRSLCMRAGKLRGQEASAGRPRRGNRRAAAQVPAEREKCGAEY